MPDIHWEGGASGVLLPQREISITGSTSRFLVGRDHVDVAYHEYVNEIRYAYS